MEGTGERKGEGRNNIIVFCHLLFVGNRIIVYVKICGICLIM